MGIRDIIIEKTAPECHYPDKEKVMFEVVGSLVLLAVIAFYTVIQIALLAARLLGRLLMGLFRH